MGVYYNNNGDAERVDGAATGLILLGTYTPNANETYQAFFQRIGEELGRKTKKAKQYYLRISNQFIVSLASDVSAQMGGVLYFQASWNNVVNNMLHIDTYTIRKDQYAGYLITEITNNGTTNTNKSQNVVTDTVSIYESAFNEQIV